MYIFLILLNIHFCFSFSHFNIDEIESLRYEIDILETPVIKNQEASLLTSSEGDEDLSPSTLQLSLRSRYGQEYRCELPDVSSFLSETARMESMIQSPPVTPGIASLLEPLYHQSCLQKFQDWWTYELCYGHDIKQYHKQEGQIVGPVISLGRYESEFNWDNTSLKTSTLPKYHSQTYVNGSRCDLIEAHRSAEVRYFCEEGVPDHIARVDEPSTCHYVVIVHTHRLCTHPYFKPRPRTHTITCNPLVTQEQYNRYITSSQKDHFENEAKEDSSKIDDSIPKFDFQDQEEDKGEEANIPLEHPSEISDLEAQVQDILEKEEYSKLLDLVEELTPDKDLDLKLLFEQYLKLFHNMDLTEEMLESTEILVKRHKESTHKILSQLMGLLGIDDQTLEKSASSPKMIDKFLNYLKKLRTMELQHLKLQSVLQQHRQRFKDHLRKFLNLLLSVAAGNIPKESVDLTETTNSFILLFHKYLKAKTEILQTIQTSWRDLNLEEGERGEANDPVDNLVDSALNSLEKMQKNYENKLKIEKAIKDKIKEYTGFKTNGEPKIEVNVIAAGYLEDGMRPITEEHAQHLQSLIVNMLFGHQEAEMETKRMQRMEQNYKLVFKDEELSDDKMEEEESRE